MQIIDIFINNAFSTDRMLVAAGAFVFMSVMGILQLFIKAPAVPMLWSILDVLWGGLGRRLDRPQRGTKDLFLRGFIFTLLTLAFVFLFGVMLYQIVAEIISNVIIADFVILALSLSVTAPSLMLWRIYRVRKNGKASEGAFYAMSRSGRVDFSNADEYTVTRLALEQGVRLFDKGLIAPLFWYTLGGVYAVLLWVGLSFLNWRYGQEGQTKGFGLFPHAGEKLMGAVPNLIAGVFLLLAGFFTPGGKFSENLKAFTRQKTGMLYGAGGWPVTVLAYVLNVSLGGPVVDLDGRSFKRSWAGPEMATAKLPNDYLKRGVYVLGITNFIVFGMLIGAMFILLT